MATFLVLKMGLVALVLTFIVLWLLLILALLNIPKLQMFFVYLNHVAFPFSDYSNPHRYGIFVFNLIGICNLGSTR